MAKCLHVAKSTVITLSTSYSVYNLLSTQLTTASFLSWFLHHHTLSTSLLVFFLSCISFLCSLPLLHWSLNTGDPQSPELALLSLYPLLAGTIHFHSFKYHLKVDDSHICVSSDHHTHLADGLLDIPHRTCSKLNT